MKKCSCNDTETCDPVTGDCTVSTVISTTQFDEIEIIENLMRSTIPRNFRKMPVLQKYYTFDYDSTTRGWRQTENAWEENSTTGMRRSPPKSTDRLVNLSLSFIHTFKPLFFGIHIVQSCCNRILFFLYMVVY